MDAKKNLKTAEEVVKDLKDFIELQKTYSKLSVQETKDKVETTLFETLETVKYFVNEIKIKEN